MFGRLETWLRQRLGLEPNASLLNQLGMKLFEQGRTAEALVQFERAVAAAPYFAAAWMNIAGCKATLGDHQSAVDCYTKAIAIDPRIMLAWNGRALANLQLQRFAEAFADFEQALALEPESLDLVYNRGVAAAAVGRPDLAVADMTLVIAHDPQRAAAWQQRGVALAALERSDDALADLQRATELDPSLADAWRELGTLHYFRGELAAAVEASSRCLALTPHDGLAANNRGCGLFLLGRFAEAGADLKQVLAEQPQFASAKKNLAWLRATCPDERYRNGAEAVALARTALEIIQWDQPQWLEVLAAAEAEAGNFAEAVRRQEEAIAASSGGSGTPAHRRLALYQSGQPFRHRSPCASHEENAPPTDTAALELIPGGRTVRFQDLVRPSEATPVEKEQPL